MNYISLFEKNAPLINTVFNDPKELKKMVNFFLSNLKNPKRMMLDTEAPEEASDEPKIEEALRSYLTNYIEPAISSQAHEDATDTNTNEFKIFQTVINNFGDKSKSKSDLHSVIKNNSSYSKVYDEAETSYNYLTSNYNLYKNK